MTGSTDRRGRADPAGRPGEGAAVFFLSDYGTEDEFVGVVHAVLQRLAPSVPVIDLTHHVPPFDVDAAAALLVRAGPHLGPGVVLAVVDPGVGTGRRGVALEVASGGPAWLVGPDNGLLVPLASSLGGVRSAVALDPRRPGPPSPGGTFDGRDVFAPAAAHLLRGGEATAIGAPVDPSTLVARPRTAGAAAGRRRPGRPGSELVATVSWIDHFGNVQLDLGPGALGEIGLVPGGSARITLDADPEGSRSPDDDRGRRDLVARWVGAFGQLEPGALGLLVDANGRVALVLDRRRADAAIGVDGPGAPVGIAVADRPRP